MSALFLVKNDHMRQVHSPEKIILNRYDSAEAKQQRVFYSFLSQPRPKRYFQTSSFTIEFELKPIVGGDLLPQVIKRNFGEIQRRYKKNYNSSVAKARQTVTLSGIPSFQSSDEASATNCKL